MSKPDMWMPLYLGDYLKDTLALNRSEHGSYLLLIMAYWQNGGPLDDDDSSLREIAKCPPPEWARTKGLMQRYFTQSDGKWHHERIDKEILRAQEQHEMALKKSAAGVQARRELGQLPPEPRVEPQDKPRVERGKNPKRTPSPSPSPIPVPSEPPSPKAYVGRNSLYVGNGEEVVRLMEHASHLFGVKEMNLNHERWYKRSSEEPDKMGRVLAEIGSFIREGGKPNNPAAMAEDLWKRFK